MLQLFDTLSRKKKPLKAADGKSVRFYACGPTVYDYAHIGNFRTFVFEDVLRRTIELSGTPVNHVMNITDVDDKTIAGAQKAGVPLKDFTQGFEHAFFEDLARLGIKKPHHTPRATEHVGAMIELIRALIAKGVAYKTADGSVYYSVKSFKHYGRLSGLKMDELRAGARVENDNYDKDNASDFALWKAHDAGDGEVGWDSPFGKGRPGWHLECSAMSTQYLGQPFDLHAGGVDLIFPHHENEIAQSEGASGKPLALHWAHCEHLLVDGRKMSKSLGNFFTLRDVLARGHSPAAVRWLLLAGHYRTQLNFTFESLEAAEGSVKRLALFRTQMLELAKLKPDYKLTSAKIEVGTDEKAAQTACSAAEKAFDAVLFDDLNTPQAIAVVFELVSETNKLLATGSLSEKSAMLVLLALEHFDHVLGIFPLMEEKKLPADLRKWVEEKMAQREAARKAKDFKLADKIREELLEHGVLLQDTPSGPKWSPA
jgi:cysteinyl-tRNA synthetase